MTQTQPDISAFILDLFGVVIAFDNDVMYRRLAQHCAEPDSALARLDGFMARREIITDGWTLPKVHRQLVEEFGFDRGYPDFEILWLEPYSWPMPGMADCLRYLSERYRLVLLSNIDRYYWKVVQRRHPELEHFDAILLSCDLRMAKPDPDVFRHAAEIAGADPTRCYFVDDTEINVAAARDLGFQTHKFRDSAQLVAALAWTGLPAGVRGSERTDQPGS